MSKDKMIVYQNQSKLILDWFNNQGISPSLLDITLISSLMADACVDGLSKDLIKRFETMDSYLKGKYPLQQTIIEVEKV